jgi:carboxymethylenebutenolidase
MKKTVFLFILFASTAFAQKRSCCVPDITAATTEMASNATFASLHTNPLPYRLQEQTGKMVTFPTDDGTTGSAYHIRAAKQASGKALFIFHEWWGLNDYIKKEAENFHLEFPDLDIYAIDLYDGQVAETKEKAQQLVAQLKDNRVRAIIRGAYTLVGSKTEIATLGWCMGGTWSLQAALMGEKQVKACVMYYGMPETSIDKLKKLNCDVLGIFGRKDHFINTEVVRTFQANMQTAGKKLTVFTYGADHAFANPSNPQFDKEATKDAHQKVIAYLKDNLK